jgi:hypothetical protein
MLSDRNYVHVCCMSRPTHSPLFDIRVLAVCLILAHTYIDTCIHLNTLSRKGHNSSLSILTKLRTGGQNNLVRFPAQARYCFLLHSVQGGSGPIRPLIHLVLGVKRLRRETDHLTSDGCGECMERCVSVAPPLIRLHFTMLNYALRQIYPYHVPKHIHLFPSLNFIPYKTSDKIKTVCIVRLYSGWLDDQG